jgi:hypothetical protein
MDRKESWSQLLALLLQTIVPLVVAGGATGILAAFKEHLPQLLYTVFLYVIWGVVIVMLLWLVLRLILGDLPNRLIRRIETRRHNRARLEMVKEWCKKWSELSPLILKLCKRGWKPTAKQRNTYAELHSWFVEKRTRLLPEWRGFYLGRTDAAYDRSLGSSASLKYRIFMHWEDPFSFFYEPSQVEEFQEHFKYTSYSDIEEVLTKLGQLNNEFIQWVSRE